MNQEQIKIRLIEQFKQPDAAIHWIMARGNLACPQYWPKRVFAIRELGLVMVVKTIDQKIPSFQVLFVKEGETKEVIRDVLLDEASLLRFAWEDISVDGHELVFSVSHVTISQTDYRFAQRDVGGNPARKTCRYSLSGNRLVCPGGEAPNDFILYAIRYRSVLGDESYRLGSISEELMTQVNKAIDSIAGCSSHHIKLKNMLRNTYSDINRSAMVKIIHALKE